MTSLIIETCLPPFQSLPHNQQPNVKPSDSECWEGRTYWSVTHAVDSTHRLYGYRFRDVNKWRFPFVHRTSHRCQCHLRSEATSKALKHLLTVLRRVPAPVNSLRPEPGLGHRPWLRAAVPPPAARVRPGLVELPVAQHRQSFLEAGVAGYNKIFGKK